jgi:thymidylate kinase
MIFCLEGPSAVGKTTLARELSRAFGFEIIPEVNELFKRPSNPSKSWYFERQLDRWSLAAKAGNSLLDGDPFQPLWYNWVYSQEGYESLDALSSFYRSHVRANSIRFPDCYLILTLDQKSLRVRKEGDTTRKRSNFDKHLEFIDPQKRYFDSLRNQDPERVDFISADSAAEEIKSLVGTRLKKTVARAPIDELRLFDTMIEWLRETSPFVT